MERGLTPFGSDRRDACPTYNDESPPSYLLQETKKVISPWVRTVGVEEAAWERGKRREVILRWRIFFF